jgi:hypothetical protein
VSKSRYRVKYILTQEQGALFDEQDEYDDCFVAKDDPEGWVYIDRVTVRGMGYRVKPMMRNGEPPYSLSNVKKMVWSTLGWSG